jgi:hypothetical protein
MRPLRWTCKSSQKLADELSKGKRSISAKSVARLLKKTTTACNRTESDLRESSMPIGMDSLNIHGGFLQKLKYL